MTAYQNRGQNNLHRTPEKSPQHLSIRVPWHDHGYDGTVCHHPKYNNACLRLKNIADKRDDPWEAAQAGQPMTGHEAKLCCLTEGGAFMSPVGYNRKTVHPFRWKHPVTHGHFLETDVPYPAYSFPARPFRWLMKDKAGEYPLGQHHLIGGEP